MHGEGDAGLWSLLGNSKSEDDKKAGDIFLGNCL